MARHARYNRAARLAAPAFVRKQASARASRRTASAMAVPSVRPRYGRGPHGALADRVLSFAVEYSQLSSSLRHVLETVIYDTEDAVDELTLRQVEQVEDSVGGIIKEVDQRLAYVYETIMQREIDIEDDADDYVEEDTRKYSYLSRR